MCGDDDSIVVSERLQFLPEDAFVLPQSFDPLCARCRMRDTQSLVYLHARTPTFLPFGGTRMVAPHTQS